MPLGKKACQDPLTYKKNAPTYLLQVLVVPQIGLSMDISSQRVLSLSISTPKIYKNRGHFLEGTGRTCVLVVHEYIVLLGIHISERYFNGIE